MEVIAQNPRDPGGTVQRLDPRRKEQTDRVKNRADVDSTGR